MVVATFCNAAAALLIFFFFLPCSLSCVVRTNNRKTTLDDSVEHLTCFLCSQAGVANRTLSVASSMDQPVVVNVPPSSCRSPSPTVVSGGASSSSPLAVLPQRTSSYRRHVDATRTSSLQSSSNKCSVPHQKRRKNFHASSSVTLSENDSVSSMSGHSLLELPQTTEAANDARAPCTSTLNEDEKPTTQVLPSTGDGSLNFVDLSGCPSLSTSHCPTAQSRPSEQHSHSVRSSSTSAPEELIAGGSSVSVSWFPLGELENGEDHSRTVHHGKRSGDDVPPCEYNNNCNGGRPIPDGAWTGAEVECCNHQLVMWSECLLGSCYVHTSSMLSEMELSERLALAKEFMRTMPKETTSSSSVALPKEPPSPSTDPAITALLQSQRASIQTLTTRLGTILTTFGRLHLSQGVSASMRLVSMNTIEAEAQARHVLCEDAWRGFIGIAAAFHRDVALLVIRDRFMFDDDHSASNATAGDDRNTDSSVSDGDVQRMCTALAVQLADAKLEFEARLRQQHDEEHRAYRLEVDEKLTVRRNAEVRLREEIARLKCLLANAYGTLEAPNVPSMDEDLEHLPSFQAKVAAGIQRALQASQPSICTIGANSSSTLDVSIISNAIGGNSHQQETLM